MEEPGSPQTSRKRQQQEESNDTHVHQYRRTQVTGLATSCRHIATIFLRLRPPLLACRSALKGGKQEAELQPTRMQPSAAQTSCRRIDLPRVGPSCAGDVCLRCQFAQRRRLLW